LLRAAKFDSITLNHGVDTLLDSGADFMVHQIAPANHNFWYLQKSATNEDFESRIRLYHNFAHGVSSASELRALATANGVSQFLAVYPYMDPLFSSSNTATGTATPTTTTSTAATASSMRTHTTPTATATVPSRSLFTSALSQASSSSSVSGISRNHSLRAPITTLPFPSNHERIFSELHERLNARGMHVIRTTSPLDKKSLWIEVFPRNVNKGSAVVQLADKLGIPLTHSVVIGNDFNDCDMLNLPEALGFVVANAPLELRNKYRCVASNDADGFSAAVDEACDILASQSKL